MCGSMPSGKGSSSQWMPSDVTRSGPVDVCVVVVLLSPVFSVVNFARRVCTRPSPTDLSQATSPIPGSNSTHSMTGSADRSSGTASGAVRSAGACVRSSAAETPGSSGPHSPADSGTTGSTETPGPSGSDSPGSEPNSEALGSPGSSATVDPAGGCCGSGGAATLSVPQAEARRASTASHTAIRRQRREPRIGPAVRAPAARRCRCARRSRDLGITKRRARRRAIRPPGRGCPLSIGRPHRRDACRVAV